MRRAAALVAPVALAALAACSRPDPAPSGGPARGTARATATGAGGALVVGHATGPLKLDGEIDEPTWTLAGRTGPFTDASGSEAHPYSEARFLWDEKNLYVMLYAADNDIRARVKDHDGPVWIDDSFALHITPTTAGAPTYTFDISAAGVTTDGRRGADGKVDTSWESGIQLGVDHDGTVNNPADEDEEWVIEAAIPLASMGIAPAAGTHLRVDIARCDTPRNTKERRCGAWGSAKEQRVLELGPAAPPAATPPPAAPQPR